MYSWATVAVLTRRVGRRVGPGSSRHKEKTLLFFPLSLPPFLNLYETVDVKCTYRNHFTIYVNETIAETYTATDRDYFSTKLGKNKF